MNFNKKILVTGAGGFIGRELVKSLNILGYYNIIVVESKEVYNERLSLGGYFGEVSGLRFIDFIDYNKVIKKKSIQLKDVDFIFHLGAITDTRVVLKDLFKENVLFTEILFFEASKLKIPVVFASTAAVYDNDKKINPLTDYGTSKLLCEKFADENVACLRYHNVFGSSELHKNNMASIIYKWKKEEKKLFIGSDSIKRDFVHVSDVNKINIMFLDDWLKYNKFPSGIYDVGTGKSESFQKVADLITAITKDKYIYIENPYNERTYQFFTQAEITDIKKLHKNTYGKDFTPLTLEESINIVYGVKKLTLFQKLKKLLKLK